MIAVELTFTADHRRLAARPMHRQRLLADGRVLLAGPWADDSGALLVFNADRSEVDTIMADDPYYTTPGVTVAAIREWRPVVNACKG